MTPTATLEPTVTPTATLEPTVTPTATPEPTSTSTPTVTPEPTSTPLPVPTSTPVPPAPTSTPVPVPTSTPNPHDAAIVPPADPATEDGTRAGQLAAILREGVDPNAVAGRYGISVLSFVDLLNLVLFGVPAGIDLDALRSLMANDPDVTGFEANSIIMSPEGHGRSEVQFSQPTNLAIQDPEYGYQLVGAIDVGCATGAGVIVAVLDTGIEVDHPDFAGRLMPGWNVIDSNDDVSESEDGIDNDADGSIDEMYGHGTHVAGIIARVAPGATILPIKVLNDDGVGDAFGLAQGIVYAMSAGADVINLSLSSLNDSEIVRKAIEAAREAGVVVVAATGNAGTAEPKEYPAAIDGVIAVAATGPDDQKSDFSNYGDEIRVSAPGTEIESSLPGGTLGVASGTSMAAPFIAAAVALAIERFPELSPAEVEARILSSTTVIDRLNPDYAGQLGAGRLDLVAALGCSS
ncbi:MAG: S8 family serine peptidase [Thermomicrobiales bacterium]